MSKNFDKKLIELLETDPSFTDQNGKLIKRIVIDKAWRTDKQLVRLLLSDTEVKAKFFDKIAGHYVFNINTLIDYISNKKFLGNSYTRFRNKIGLNIDGKFLKERGEVSLVWPYKDCVLEGGQTKEEETRKEIFFNEILAHDEINRLFDPKVLTNWKRHTVKGTEPVSKIKRDKNGTLRENFIVKGNNLLALHTLKQQFQGKVKLVYMDPPFNTKGDANTFLYNNNFNHSGWLTFMKNRLEVARKLLSENGIAVIAIDHAELFYIGVLADEIFSRKNRIGIISVQTNPGGRSDAEFFATSSEFFLVYAKEREIASINLLPLTEEQKAVFKFKDDFSPYRWCPFRRGGSNSTPADRPNLFYSIFYNEKTGYIGLEKTKESEKIIPLDSNGVKRVWRQSKERFMEAVAKEDIRIKKGPRGYIVDLKDRIKKGRKPKTIWIDPSYDASSHGTRILKNIFQKNNIFSYPKSKHLMKDIIKITTEKNALILDFFAGSGTTASAVLELNQEDKGSRKFILCEQMDYINKVTVPRVCHVAKQNLKEDFIYCELMKYNEVFMDKIQMAKSSKELVKLWKDISKNSFLNWYVNPEVPEDALNDFVKIGEEDFSRNQNQHKSGESKTNTSGKTNGLKAGTKQKKPEEWKNQKYIEKTFGAVLEKNKTGLERQKNLLAELLNKNQLYVLYSEIDDKDFKVSQEDKHLNQLFYGEN